MNRAFASVRSVLRTAIISHSRTTPSISKSFSSCSRPSLTHFNLRRPLRSIASRYQYSTAATSFPDPSRPDLYYHYLDPPTPLNASLPAFALSFLPEPPHSPESPSVIGWLPAQIYEADCESEDNLGLEKQQDAGLNDFKENPKFTEVLHRAIKEALRENSDVIWTNGAKQLQNGWMHIQDQRNIPALGRVGDPDDIIASVLVRDSEILADTYQPMPAYRLCTADGVSQLTLGLQEKLTEMLNHIQEHEKAA